MFEEKQAMCKLLRVMYKSATNSDCQNAENMKKKLNAHLNASINDDSTKESEILETNPHDEKCLQDLNVNSQQKHSLIPTDESSLIVLQVVGITLKGNGFFSFNLGFVGILFEKCFMNKEQCPIMSIFRGGVLD